MKKIICLTIFLLSIGLVLPDKVDAQSKKNKREIFGKVVDQSGVGLSGVLITADEGISKATTDVTGVYKLTIKAGGQILIEKKGYEKVLINDVQLSQTEGLITLEKSEFFRGKTNNVHLPFQTTERYRTTGLISVITPDEEMARDTRFNIATAIAGKTPGMAGAWNIHGLGNAVTVIDGVPRDQKYFNLQEIEQITVLKDPISRMLYGADANQGVVFMTTKRGQANKRVIKVSVESGMQSAISFPKYLDAATYMEKYNMASRNEGSISDVYGADLIANTRSKVDPVLYPDNNFFGDTFVKSMTNFTNLYAETSGGNDKAQYFMNLGWKHNEGWIALAEKDNSDLLSVRGNVDYKVNNWLKMSADAIVIFDMTNQPNIANFWDKTTTIRPNLTTLLIPTSRVNNLDQLSSPVLYGDYLLGGSTNYQENLYGEILRKGTLTTMNRFLQFNTGMDFDMNKITKGLSARAFLTFDFNNSYNQYFDNNYAIYEIGQQIDAQGNFSVSKIGVDKTTTKKNIEHVNMYFNRNIGAYATLNYDRTFGDHSVSGVGVAYRKQFNEKDVFQTAKRLGFGVQANYMYKDKYIAEAGLMGQGSSKIKPGKRFAVAPTFGAAWVISKENFMKDVQMVDYMKIRTSFGILLDDNWDKGSYKGYFLYEPYYSRGTVFNYGNGLMKNNELNIPSTINDLTFQKRREFVAGFEASALKNKLWVEAAYFNSLSYDNVTEQASQTSLLGGITRFHNYNSTRNSGFEMGVKYGQEVGEFYIKGGVSMLYSVGKVVKKDEQQYTSQTNKHLATPGTYTDAMWALTAIGLYSNEDFDGSGKLNSEFPTVSYGEVKPGDIKYLDYNKDGIINDDDKSIVDYSGNRLQFGVTIDVNYKNWQLFVLATGAYGGKGFKSGNYYWIKGTEAKYSEVALDAYDPENPDPNAKYPRLTTGNGSNNYRNSTFWLYDKGQFSLDAVQLGYNFKFKQSSAIQGLNVYLRGSNLLTIAKDRQILQLSVGSTPQNRVFALGVVSSF